MAELAYALVSEASGATLESSNLSFRTMFAEGEHGPESPAITGSDSGPFLTMLKAKYGK